MAKTYLLFLSLWLMILTPLGAQKNPNEKKPGGKPDDASIPLEVQRPLYGILGRPEARQITLRILSNQTLWVQVKYGLQGGPLNGQTQAQKISRPAPGTWVLSGLNPQSTYQYEVYYGTSDQEIKNLGYRAVFQTAKAPGQGFSFVIQSDSHLLNKADKPLYQQNLKAMGDLNPDLFFDLGDTFLNDKDLQIPQDTVDAITFQQVPYLSLLAQKSPLFLVIGNHEGEYGFLGNGTAKALPVYAAEARKRYFPNPVPTSFFTGNLQEDPFIGPPENYYAFTWGDALFVALDPYRYTLKDPAQTKDPWDWTLGETQYKWLKKTLETSQAKYKIVFIHHINGNSRGGAQVAGLYEWGGKEKNGQNTFAQKRPGWDKPVAQLLEDTGVNLVFQGHDHIFSREKVGKVIYQTLPKPAEKIPDQENNLRSFPQGANQINTGYLSVRVDPAGVQVDYHRPHVSGSPESGATGVVHSYKITSQGTLEVLKTTDDAQAFQAYGQNKDPDKEKNRDKKNPDPQNPGPGKQNENPKPPTQVQDPSGEKKPGIPTDYNLEKVTAPYGKRSGALVEFPGRTSVGLSLFFPSPVEFMVKYGPSSQVPAQTTPWSQAPGNQPHRTRISNLSPGTEYHFEVWTRSQGKEILDIKGRWTTVKSPGQGFSFVVEADPHWDENSSPSVYQKILAQMVQTKSDLAFDLGDTSMTEKLARDLNEHLARNRLVHSWWLPGLEASLPMFMTLGNHDGEYGWKPQGKNPRPQETAPIRRAWLWDPSEAPKDSYNFHRDWAYSFTWGDALFLVLDPFSFTKTKPSDNLWDWTLGESQYKWMESQLASHKTKYKFVFIHNLLGGVTKDTRGGAAIADKFEWGGKNLLGVQEFPAKRPGWTAPIHDLLVKFAVDVVFHGHDHFYAKEEKDGVIYQLVPQPALGRTQALNQGMLQEYGYLQGDFKPSPGFLKISVDPQSARVDFLQGPSGTLGDSYTLKP